MVQAEKRVGLGIALPTVEQQKDRPQLTHEDIVKFVGEDYQEIADKKLQDLGLIEEGESLHFNFPDPHNGSKGDYAFEGTLGDHWVFIYHLGRNSRTTLHRHLSTQMTEFVEDYHVLKGEIALLTGKAGEPIKKTILNEENPSFRVEPDTRHRAVTYEDNAYMLVVMPNSAHIPRDQLHSE